MKTTPRIDLHILDPKYFTGTELEPFLIVLNVLRYLRTLHIVNIYLTQDSKLYRIFLNIAEHIITI